MVADVRMGRLVQGALGCRSGACCCCRVGERTQDWREVQEVVHLVGGLACVEVGPKPSGAQWGLEDEEGRVLGVEGPVEVVGDQGEGHILEEGGLGAGDPLEVGRTDQGRAQGEEACRHDLEDQRGEGVGPGQEVVVLEGRGDQVDLEGGVGDPAYHLKESTNKKKKKREVHETKEDLITIFAYVKAGRALPNCFGFNGEIIISQAGSANSSVESRWKTLILSSRSSLYFSCFPSFEDAF